MLETDVSVSHPNEKMEEGVTVRLSRTWDGTVSELECRSFQRRRSGQTGLSTPSPHVSPDEPPGRGGRAEGRRPRGEESSPPCPSVRLPTRSSSTCSSEGTGYGVPVGTIDNYRTPLPPWVYDNTVPHSVRRSLRTSLVW